MVNPGWKWRAVALKQVRETRTNLKIAFVSGTDKTREEAVGKAHEPSACRTEMASGRGRGLGNGPQGQAEVTPGWRRRLVALQW